MHGHLGGKNADDIGNQCGGWTIEWQGRAPAADRAQQSDHLFGCDVCQDVCPWNRQERARPQPDLPDALGLRARLTTKGAGKWVESTGDRSKFGLSSMEIGNAIERMRSEDMLESLELLHFHIGSQIPYIRKVYEAVIRKRKAA